MGPVMGLDFLQSPISRTLIILPATEDAVEGIKQAELSQVSKFPKCIHWRPPISSPPSASSPVCIAEQCYRGFMPGGSQVSCWPSSLSIPSSFRIERFSARTAVAFYLFLLHLRLRSNTWYKRSKI